MHVFRWIIPFLFSSHDTRHKLERELLTWSFQNARGIVACSLNLFKYQTLLIRIRLNRNFYSFKIFSRAMSAGNFFSHFFLVVHVEIGLGRGGGDFTVVSQHQRVANALYMYRYFQNYLCTTYLFCISRWPTIFKPVLHLPYLLNIV